MRLLHVVLPALALCAAGPAAALYKVVGPDGRVTYTDQAPPADAPAQAQIKTSASPSDGNASLPYELRQVATKFPVILYTKDDCTPCGLARNHLRERGVPYTEKTVNTPADIEAYQRAEGTTTIPIARVGGQQLKGFAAGEWSAYLDAAGYPRHSALPGSYRHAAAQPMVARETVATARGERASSGETDRAEPAQTASTASPATSSAPRAGTGGIRF